jgi:hypothetical protein
MIAGRNLWTRDNVISLKVLRHERIDTDRWPFLAYPSCSKETQ